MKVLSVSECHPIHSHGSVAFPQLFFILPPVHYYLSSPYKPVRGLETLSIGSTGGASIRGLRYGYSLPMLDHETLRNSMALEFYIGSRVLEFFGYCFMV